VVAVARAAPTWAPARVPEPIAVERVVAGPPVRPPASTYRRRRAVAAGLVVVLVLAVWVALGAFGGGPLPVPERPARLDPGTSYVVEPGDTMWSIAQRLSPAGDPRPVVDRLVAAHGTPTLYVGEQIVLPAP
jgi:Tfp pilus assembly protein FimV